MNQYIESTQSDGLRGEGMAALGPIVAKPVTTMIINFKSALASGAPCLYMHNNTNEVQFQSDKYTVHKFQEVETADMITTH